MGLPEALETIFLGIISGLGSAFIIFLFTSIFGKKKILINTRKKKFDISNFTPFTFFLFITSFFSILSLFGFYNNWANFSYLVTIAMVFGFLTAWIYNNQCPKCKKIFVKKRIHTEILKEEKRPYRYRDLTIYLYSDNEEKDRKYGKKDKTIMETIRTQRDYFKCKACNHEWGGESYERNLNIKNRPKPNIVRTKIKNPNEFSI